MEGLRVQDNEGDSFIREMCVWAHGQRTEEGIQCPALALSALFS